MESRAIDKALLACSIALEIAVVLLLAKLSGDAGTDQARICMQVCMGLMIIRLLHDVLVMAELKSPAK